MNSINLLGVGLGGGLGSLLRWRVGLVVNYYYKGELPLATFVINITGAFLIGYLSTLFKVDWQNRYDGWIGTVVLTGVLGGYTTFSSMQLDAANLRCVRGKIASFAYLMNSVVSGIAAASIGAWLAYSI